MDHPLKHTIWSLTKDVDLIKRHMQAVKLANPDDYWAAVLRRVEQAIKPRKKARKSAELSDEAKARYRQAKYARELRDYPSWINDGHFIEPDWSKLNVATANGLTTFIINFINWSGGNATRVSSEGKAIVKNGEIVRIPSSTRNGSADVTATVKGRSVKLEVKVGSDRPSPAQLKEQARERAAGGIYEFITSPEDLFRVWDSIVGKDLFS